MISTFKGQRRTLGRGEVQEFLLTISVELRNYLHLFKGSSLNVFLFIALHIDDKGWAWPTVETIKRQIGKKDEETVYRALNNLCGMKIAGDRLMLRTQNVPPHVPAEKITSKRPRNFYLIFPSDEEIERYEKSHDESERSTPEKSDAKKRYPEKSDAKNTGTKNYLNPEDHPLNTQPEPHTHEQARARRGLFPAAAAGGTPPPGVCVNASGSRHPRAVNERYAWHSYRNDLGVRNPTGWVTANMRTGEWDADVDRFLETESAEYERSRAGRQEPPPEFPADLPTPEPEAEGAWDVIAEHVRNSIAPASWATWFQYARPLRLEGGRLFVFAGEEIVRDWITTEYEREITVALAALDAMPSPWGKVRELVWVVAKELKEASVGHETQAGD